MLSRLIWTDQMTLPRANKQKQNTHKCLSGVLLQEQQCATLKQHIPEASVCFTSCPTTQTECISFLTSATNHKYKTVDSVTEVTLNTIMSSRV